MTFRHVRATERGGAGGVAGTAWQTRLACVTVTLDVALNEQPTVPAFWRARPSAATDVTHDVPMPLPVRRPSSLSTAATAKGSSSRTQSRNDSRAPPGLSDGTAACPVPCDRPAPRARDHCQLPPRQHQHQHQVLLMPVCPLAQRGQCSKVGGAHPRSRVLGTENGTPNLGCLPVT